MTINEKKNTIELTKKENAAAAKYGTPEYKALQQARKDYPDFKVVTITCKSTAQKGACKGLTYEYISKCQQQSLRYPTIKKWFLRKYPEVAKFGTIEADYEAQFES